MDAGLADVLKNRYINYILQSGKFLLKLYFFRGVKNTGGIAGKIFAESGWIIEKNRYNGCIFRNLC
jgi:hypothetical protein